MGGEDKMAIYEIADRQRQLIDREAALRAGRSDSGIKWRVDRGEWQKIHAGVYQIDRRAQDWKDRLMAAVLAAGQGSVVSHRAAFALWELDGISTTVVELTVPYTHGPVPRCTIVHRSRRPIDSVEVGGIPVTSVERTLLDCAAQLSDLIIGKGLDSAIRTNLTSVDATYDLLVERGGRGVRGTRRMRRVLGHRIHDTATGSGAEFELLTLIQSAFLPRPELQYPLFPDGERRVPDFYWPRLRKAVEVDGLDAHSSADRLDDDLRRQNALLDMGIELRRFSARDVRRNPTDVVRSLRRFLEA